LWADIKEKFEQRSEGGNGKLLFVDDGSDVFALDYYHTLFLPAQKRYLRFSDPLQDPVFFVDKKKFCDISFSNDLSERGLFFCDTTRPIISLTPFQCLGIL